MKKAYFAGGCFWSVENKFSQIIGVKEVKSGYMGGVTDNPTYEEVCSGVTEHAETVEIIYDENIITYKKLLIYFFSFHNPTTLNKQGIDIGTQYRSAIFYLTELEKETALKVINEITNSNKYLKQIVTEVIKGKKFYLAEEYHQNYFTKKGIIIPVKK
ncbi:MAG: peptide-methionine (S)-S-oxide reductase MsrA [Bacillota bacterium]|nr:peptide-methionine (S)-S-oxide reductase MsrA [Bacillota bacterium]